MASDPDHLGSAEAYPGAASNSASPASQILELAGTPSYRTSPGNKSPSVGPEPPLAPTTVSAACLACRGKHLKCDGQTPCLRCINSATECTYVASRRGYKGPRRGAAQKANKRLASSSPNSTSGSSAIEPLGSNTAPSSSETVALDTISSSLFTAPTLNSNSSHLFPSYHSSNSHSHGHGHGGLIFSNNAAIPAQVPVPTVTERCLDAFYHYFHQAHPFVLPREPLLRIAKEGTINPLLAAMQWIGSLYMEMGPGHVGFFEEARRLAYEPERPKDGFLVQAFMLLIIGLDGSGEQERAREILGDAERMALQISLNTRTFAAVNGRGLPVLEESWRRTWWDLFVIDGMIAGTHRITNFLLFDIPADVALPCEEQQYLSGNIPPPAHLEDLEDCEFSGDDREFSSFAYRILCARNLGKLMRIPPIFGAEDGSLDRIEALLTNWRLHLPESKQNPFSKDGQLDEMMFQAHMMVHATSILLHQPHSQLDSSPTRTVNSCAPYHPVSSRDGFNTHTRHTIRAANEISKLITHRVPLLSHTHFFACVISLSSIVHLSKWALFFIPHDDDDLRQQIRLNIGALRKMSQVWNSSDQAAAQVTSVAQEIYRVKKQQQMTSQYWLGMSQEEVLNNIAADDSLINEIETIQNLGNLLG